MKTRKILALALVFIMAISVIPMASLAEGARTVTYEARQMRKLSKTWAVIDAAEKKALDEGLSRSSVLNAALEAALNSAFVDKDSISLASRNDPGFYFSVDGMLCAYNYRLRNELMCDDAPSSDAFAEAPLSGKSGKATEKPASERSVNAAGSGDVLLIGPYYGLDHDFTDQYKNEAQSIANTTGGTYTFLLGSDATGPAIARHFIDKGVIIISTHGVQRGNSTYICLTTSEGITSEDYSNGWALNTSGGAYIDGRYIENHIDGRLSNTFIWMGMCQGMMREGKGTTARAFLSAGASGVYGYSQDVTFLCDYRYEATFWNEMRSGATVAEAISVMKEAHGNHDPHRIPPAWPIVVSPSDPFPENPDSEQQVNCSWRLTEPSGSVELASFTLDSYEKQMVIDETAFVNFNTVPVNANAYELVWSSSNSSVALVNGSKAYASIKAVGFGEAVVTCTVLVNGSVFGSAQILVRIPENEQLKAALNTAGGSLSFVSAGSYPFTVKNEDGRSFAESGNAGISDSTSVLSMSLNMNEGETLTFDYRYSCESNYDWFDFNVNDVSKLHLTGTYNDMWKTYTFTAPSTGRYKFEWLFIKDESTDNGSDCVRIDNVSYSGSGSVAPTATPRPTATPAPTATPRPTATPAPTATPRPTATPAPTATPRPTATPAPTATPRPTATPAPTATPRPTAAPLEPSFVEVSAPIAGESYVIVIDERAVANTIHSNNHYLTAKAVIVNSGSITVPSTVDASSILWTVGGSADSGWTFKNVENGKYMGLDSAEYLYPSDAALAWKYENGDLDNLIDSAGYYYLSLSNDGTYFTTSTYTNGRVKLYRYVQDGANPTAAPTAAPTATPRPTATPAPTATPRPTATPAPTAAPTGSYVEVSAPASGEQYVIVINGRAVGNTTYSNNRYLMAQTVTVNGSGTLTIPSDVNANDILWTVGGSANSGWTFRNVGNGRYMSLDTNEYLYPGSTAVAWKYENGDLNNQIDSAGYYYLALNPAKTYFTTGKSTNGSVKLYRYVQGNAPTPDPTAIPTAVPTAAPTAAPTPTAAPVVDTYVEVSAPRAGEQYVVVINNKAVGNTTYSNNRYLMAQTVTVNGSGTLTIPSGVNANDVLWTVGGNATSGWTFRNVANGKYMGLDSAEYLTPSNTAVAWKYENGDLNNQIDSEGYYYLTVNAAKTYFTTGKSTNGSVRLFKLVPANGAASAPVIEKPVSHGFAS